MNFIVDGGGILEFCLGAGDGDGVERMDGCRGERARPIYTWFSGPGSIFLPRLHLIRIEGGFGCRSRTIRWAWVGSKDAAGGLALGALFINLCRCQVGFWWIMVDFWRRMIGSWGVIGARDLPVVSI